MPGIPLRPAESSPVKPVKLSAKAKGKARATEDSAALPPKYSFNTVAREKRFADPSTSRHDAPELEELTAPHIQSFDALFEGSKGPDGKLLSGDPGKGLLELAVRDVQHKVFFDGRGTANKGLGNRIERKLSSTQ